jgi:hypothetical protein
MTAEGTVGAPTCFMLPDKCKCKGGNSLALDQYLRQDRHLPRPQDASTPRAPKTQDNRKYHFPASLIPLGFEPGTFRPQSEHLVTQSALYIESVVQPKSQPDNPESPCCCSSREILHYL